MNSILLFLEQNGIKKARLANLLNVSKAFVTQLCNGERKLAEDKLELLKKISLKNGWDTSMFEGAEPKYGTKVTVNARDHVYANVDGKMEVVNPEAIASLTNQIKILKDALNDEKERYNALLKMLDNERTIHAQQMQKLIEKL